MKRKIVLLICICMLSLMASSCKNNGVEVSARFNESTTETYIDSENESFDSGCSITSRTPTYYPGVGEILPDILEETNKNKEIHTQGAEQKIMKEYGFSEESEKIITEFCEDVRSEENESIATKTYVYTEERLRTRFYANHDHGEDIGTIAQRCMQDYLDGFPTEAIRLAEDGSYCTIYDTDTSVRLFVWYKIVEKTGRYEQIGYPIYMAETLSYNDFSKIKIGDDAAKIEEIDPKVLEIHLWECNQEEEQYTHNRINNGYPPRSLHLLTDGLLVITYGRDGDNFPITDIEFHEDFMIDTVAGPQCCKINPLDYVTQG